MGKDYYLKYKKNANKNVINYYKNKKKEYEKTGLCEELILRYARESAMRFEIEEMEMLNLKMSMTPDN